MQDMRANQFISFSGGMFTKTAKNAAITGSTDRIDFAAWVS